MSEKNKSICPKCQYQRQPKDRNIYAGTCPNCGIAYAKWRPESENHTDKNDETTFTVRQSLSVTQKLIRFFMYVPATTDPFAFWGRAFLWCIFLLWGGYFILNGVSWDTIGGSFLHSINLPFHEFGHVLFSPFGRFMSILGGSLFQIIMPLIALFSFSIQMRDNFAASIMLWWTGQNMIDVSPYIADAQYRAIPLIRGLGEEYHDWGNLLTMVDCVECAPAIANTVFSAGTITIMASLTWSALILKKQKENLSITS